MHRALVLRESRITLFDRRARIAGGLAGRLGLGEWNILARRLATVIGMRAPTQGPPRVRGQGNRDVWQPHARNVVAIAVGPRHEAWIDRAIHRHERGCGIDLVRRSHYGRKDARNATVVKGFPQYVAVAGRLEPRIRGLAVGSLTEWIRDIRGESSVGGQGHGAVEEPGHPARWRFHAVRPGVEGEKERTLHGRRVQRIVELLAQTPACAVPGAVPHARHEVRARVWRVRKVRGAVRRRMQQRSRFHPVFVARVDLDAEWAGTGGLTLGVA